MTRKIQKSATFVAAAMIASVAGAQGISVKVDGQPVSFNNAGPRSVDGRVLVPLRGVFEQMGAYVQWDAANREVTAKRGGKNLRLKIGEREATVDGRQLSLDVPAMILNGATMVPIRFLSESLGAQVRWQEADRMVLISTDGSGSGQVASNLRDRQGRDRDVNGRYRDAKGVWRDAPRRWQDQNGAWHEVGNGTQTGGRAQVLADDTILPVKLDGILTSNGSQRGQRFTATVRSSGNDYYGMLPVGTKVEGRVVTARAQSGNNPGILELDFQQLRLPNGRTYPIEGELVSLDGKGVVRESDGRIRATGAARDNRGVYAGYGAGAGLIVGLLTKKPLEGSILGGVLGYIAGQVQKDHNGKASNVRLEPGTEFGVRLSEAVTLQARDIRNR